MLKTRSNLRREIFKLNGEKILFENNSMVLAGDYDWTKWRGIHWTTLYADNYYNVDEDKWINFISHTKPSLLETHEGKLVTG